MLKEFREFALKGNMVDLAIAVIIGGAFGAIIASLVKDILMPPLGKLVGGVDFAELFIVLGGGTYPSLKAAKDAGAATINYGIFINTLINFLLVAWALFFVVKGINSARRQPAPAAPTEKECPHCAMKISIRARRCPHCTSPL
ncbi:MAG TPA: large conductance mechanosensitive channel protein MscL [Methylomirabilota bacterium]|jgi:large conductance mechanosensitive channel|nr:large conductance mechanosensitive channel protein MscL [Methylomirabilota bacterium]